MVTVRLPRLLADMVGGIREVSVEAGDVDGALRAACRQHPALAVHLFDETEGLRTHVTVLHNGDVVRDALDRRVQPCDNVDVLQAVSGG